MGSPSQTLDLLIRIASIGVIISTAELIAVRTQLAPDGFLNFEIPQTRARWLVASPVGQLVTLTLRYPVVLAVIAVRMAAALALLTGALQGGTVTLAVGLVALTGIALALRTPFGNDGADQMTTLIFVSATLARFAHGGAAATAALWFLALQTCLSYLTAGAAKIISPVWRNGDAIRGIFRTTVYGHSRISAVVERWRVLALVAGWSVITTECLFTLALLSPRPLVYLFLVGGLTFHLASAFFMGLNTFLWAFGSTYPAVLFAADRVSAALWGHSLS